MNGTDHQLPQPWLGRVVAEANDDPGRLPVRGDVAGRVPRRPADRRARRPWTGELRSGARANVLMGVASNRVDVHQACAAAERALERRAEPLARAPAAGRPSYPAALLELGLAQPGAQQRARLVLRVQPRRGRRPGRRPLPGGAPDRRRARASGAARASRPRSTRRPARRSSSTRPPPTAAVWSTAIVPGDGPVHFDDAATARRCPTQVLRTPSAARRSRRSVERPEGALGARDDARPGVRRARASAATTSSAMPTTCVDVRLPRRRPPASPPSTSRSCARSSPDWAPRARHVPVPGAAPAGPRGDRSPPTRYPGSAGARYRAADGRGPGDGRRRPATRVGRERAPAGRGRPGDGTFTLDDRRRARASTGLGRLVDGGDGGDTYNYSPPGDGPDRRRARSGRRHRGRVGAGAGAAARRRDLRVAGRRRSATNGRARRRTDETVDRRRRARRSSSAPASASCGCAPSSTTGAATTVCAPTSRCPPRSTGSDAECAFAVVRRGLDGRGRAARAGAAHVRVAPVRRRAPTARPVSRSLHDGLLEYEVVDDGPELALTLLRATGYLSRAEPSLRPNPAGPLDPLDGPAAAAARTRSSTRSSPTGATGGRPGSTTSPTRCWCRSSGCGAAAAPAPPGRRPAGSCGSRARRCRR